MASSWIKLRVDLDTDPRVLTMADFISQSAGCYVLNPSASDLLGVTPTVTRNAMRDVTLAALFRVWRDANRHTSDGVFNHCTLEHLDTIAGIPSFGRAMAAIGWAVEDTAAHTVTLVNFLEMNTPAKEGRSSNAIRQQRYRQKKSNADSNVTPPVTTPTDTEPDTEPNKGTPPPRARPASVPSSEAQAIEQAALAGVPADYASTIYHEQEGINWLDSAGRSVVNWQSYVKARHNQHVNRQGGQRPHAGGKAGTTVEAPLSRPAAYARWMQAKEEAATIRKKNFTSETDREAALARLHTLERTITQLESDFQFTN